jgi:hypothetical protein
MDPKFREFLAGELKQIREQGLINEEWPIIGEKGPENRVLGRKEVPTSARTTTSACRATRSS